MNSIGRIVFWPRPERGIFLREKVLGRCRSRRMKVFSWDRFTSTLDLNGKKWKLRRLVGNSCLERKTAKWNCQTEDFRQKLQRDTSNKTYFIIVVNTVHKQLIVLLEESVRFQSRLYHTLDIKKPTHMFSGRLRVCVAECLLSQDDFHCSELSE